MVCSKCKNAGILNTVLGKNFYYCKTCKEEIFLEEVVPPEPDYDYAAPIYYLETSDDGYDPDDDYDDHGDAFDPI